MADARIETTASDGHVRLALRSATEPTRIDEGLMADLDEAIARIEDDDSVAVVSIVGGGDSFCVGADLEAIAGWLREERWDELVTFLHDGQRLMGRVADLPVPTVAGINGYALGGGLELALACDIRFAAEGAILGFPESTLGMIPGWGGTQRLVPVVGASAAKDLLLTGEHVASDRAHALGLVDRVVADDELAEAVEAYAAEVADKPTATVRHLMAAVEAATATPTDGDLAAELLNDLLASMNEETERRIEAFLAR